ncbi:acetyltransferase [Aureobasidium pullulans]|uniref:Glucosamine 6-phosphate N-acetyltransferase n=1 Tax=Aureobasidium pullulans TaxID=5580 RepID=A0A4S8VCL7_AURPU|nr:acetyltransferase [Aureobasidium pullulans]
MASPDLSLFPATLLPTSASSSLPKPYTIRPLHRTDHAHGYLTCLSSLTWIGDISAAQFEQRFDWMKTKGKEWYYCIVIDDGEKIVGAATMILDRKFIQNFTTIAHVEEVCISSSHQKQGLGLLLINALNALAMESLGVDKLILNCSEDNVGFYEKCGYERAGVQMRVERKK